MNINLLLLRKCNKILCTWPPQGGSLCPYMQLSWLRYCYKWTWKKIKPNWIKCRYQTLTKPGSISSCRLVKFTCTLFGEKRMRKSDILNKRRRTWFVAFSGFFFLPFIKSSLIQTDKCFIRNSLPQCTAHQLTFCIMHRHRKRITTQEAMVCFYHLPKCWDSQLQILHLHENSFYVCIKCKP